MMTTQAISHKAGSIQQTFQSFDCSFEKCLLKFHGTLSNIGLLVNKFIICKYVHLILNTLQIFP